MSERASVGRKPVPRPERRKHTPVSMSPNERKAAEEKARAAGTNFSDFVRRACEAYTAAEAARSVAEDREARRVARKAARRAS